MKSSKHKDALKKLDQALKLIKEVSKHEASLMKEEKKEKE